MKKLAEHTIKQYRMIPDGVRVLCGLSGGADSVCLVLCLTELGYDVCACHLNHGLRGAQADADEAFCTRLCDRLGIPFRSERCDARQVAEDKKLSVETAARALRYDFFDRCAREFQAQRIATAHTADDNLETMLFHLIRGSGSAGLAGIPPVRENIIRPLIHVERRQIEHYLNERGQDWRTDATNLDDGCTRNRIRHHVIPALREIEPAAARHAGEAAERLRQDDACLEALADDGEELQAERLRAMPEALKTRAVRRLLRRSGVPMGEVGAKHIRAVCGLAERKRGSVSLPGRMHAVRRGDRLCIEAAAEQPEEIRLQPEVPVQFGKYSVLITRNRQDIHSSFKHYPISYDTISSCEISVRTWRREDRMTIPGARGARSLKRLYAERGIRSDTRDMLPVLCCDGTVIAAAEIGVEQAFCGSTGVLLLWEPEKREEKKI